MGTSDKRYWQSRQRDEVSRSCLVFVAMDRLGSRKLRWRWQSWRINFLSVQFEDPGQRQPCQRLWFEQQTCTCIAFTQAFMDAMLTSSFSNVCAFQPVVHQL